MSQISLEYRNVFVVAKLDVNYNPEKTAEYRIRGTPTFILFYNGEIVTTTVGFMQKETLVEKVLEGLVSVIEPPLTQQQADSE